MDPLPAGGLAVVADAFGLESLLSFAVGAAVALLGMGGMYLVVRRFLPKAPADTPPTEDQQRLAEARAQELIEKSRRDADQLLREAELKARDDAMRRREELTRELETARNDLRELERRAEKREATAEQKQKDLARNVLVIGQGHEHPLMMSRHLRTRLVDWVTGEPALPLQAQAKTRYRQPDQACTLRRALDIGD